MLVASTGAAGTDRAAPPAPRRMSRSALHATHTKKRYRTARKPNFKPTETGSSIALRLLQLESQDRGAELDLVALPDHVRTLYPPPIDPRPVGGSEVSQHPRAAARTNLGVLAGDVGVAQDHVALAAAAEHGPSGAHHH